MDKQLLTTNRKALTVNLDELRYGTFAEIGAGQEVARHFFVAGAASGTIAKTISAYDMKFSDAIYGKATRYVSSDRLTMMLDHEYDLLRERLWETRSDHTTFFVFADTVAAKAYHSTHECHGWMGIRFQLHPGAEPNDIIIHVRMLDKENVAQQEALGLIGVNLIYGAFYYADNPSQLVESLADNIGTDRIEVDMVKFSGPDFQDVDNRLMSLQLIHHELTNAVMFGPGGEVIQPSEVLHNKSILVERGSFRPVTKVNMDMLRCGCAQFMQEPKVKGTEMLVLMEITMRNLLAAGSLDHRDFLARVDTLSALGNTVLISNYSEYYRLTSYFRRYTKEMIGVVLGINNLLEVFNESYYDHLEGGILESFGRMFRHSVKLYVYPMLQNAYHRYLSENSSEQERILAGKSFADNVLIDGKNVQVAPNLRNLYAHLRENHFVECIQGFDSDLMNIFSRDVLDRIKGNDPSWKEMVPSRVAEIIEERHLFTDPAPEDRVEENAKSPSV